MATSGATTSVPGAQVPALSKFEAPRRAVHRLRERASRGLTLALVPYAAAPGQERPLSALPAPPPLLALEAPLRAWWEGEASALTDAAPDSAVGDDEAIARALGEEDDVASLALARELQREERDGVACALSQLSVQPWRQPPEAPLAPGEDRARLRSLLALYGVEEGAVLGDGACQFRALSDQLYRTETHHGAVRAAVLAQLRREPARYAPFCHCEFQTWLQELERSDTWGDHVTLQAAADAYGARVCVVTTYSENAYLEVVPCAPRTQRCLWLSLHAEVHYNSLYPRGEVPRHGQDRVEQLQAEGRRWDG